MAEYNSLYLKLEISEEKLRQFFSAKPVPSVLDGNWLHWWESREMYNKQSLASIPSYRTETNRAVLDELILDRNCGAIEQYDQTANRWTFMVIFFSENYQEILPMLSLIASLAPYQDMNQKGAAIIYDYYWGATSVMAYLTFSNRQIQLHQYHKTDEILPAFLAEAKHDLDHAVEKLSQQFED